MLKFFVEICVGIMICTAPVEVKPPTPPTPIFDACEASLFNEEGFTEVKPSSDSIQELLVVRQCDKY